jgi:hypothetical protein
MNPYESPQPCQSSFRDWAWKDLFDCGLAFLAGAGIVLWVAAIDNRTGNHLAHWIVPILWSVRQWLNV